MIYGVACDLLVRGVVWGWAKERLRLEDRLLFILLAPTINAVFKSMYRPK